MSKEALYDNLQKNKNRYFWKTQSLPFSSIISRAHEFTFMLIIYLFGYGFFTIIPSYSKSLSKRIIVMWLLFTIFIVNWEILIHLILDKLSRILKEIPFVSFNI